ncbi:MAG TPA: MBOAT family protein [Thermodesulfobacteriota bacterium]|nr:MBOAT family protein [Thermodesulfobacteriota bacterium]
MQDIIKWSKFIPVIVLPVLALASRPSFSSWELMWLMGFSIYAGCKWLTWCRALEKGMRPSLLMSLGYLLFWLGMDAQEFLDRKTKIGKPTRKLWCIAIIKTLLGAILLWGVPRLLPVEQPLLIGWVGALGLLLLLFFGIFHIFALIWQELGINARHIMNSPLLATSLSDFWGRRWNLAVHQLAQELVFQPLVRPTGVAWATFMAFLASGLAHELITSLPAGGGYGLPTSYFVLQSFGVFVERSKLGRGLGLGRGPLGWLFTFVFTACPFFLLFHPPFIINVIIPFMTKIHAI